MDSLTVQPMNGSGFVLQSQIWVPRPRQIVFPFFAEAGNLEALTPPSLAFRILTDPPIEMREGALIDYRLALHGIPFRWRTRIAVWEPPVRFVDEQLRGPYRRWVHVHAFFDEEGGTRIEDRVEYSLLGGRLVNRMFVQPRLERIFRYRARVIAERFC